MKPGLRRIEATLDQLGIQPVETQPVETQTTEGELVKETADLHSVISPGVVQQPGTVQKSGTVRKGVQKQAVSTKPKGKLMTIEPFPLPKPGADRSALAAPSISSTAQAPAPGHPGSGHAGSAGSTDVSPAPLTEMNSTPPHSSGITSSITSPIASSRPAANPNLAVGLLKEVETIVRGWQRELEQVVQQIQTVYQEGPIVDGWLESHAINSSQTMAPGVSVLRHAEIEHLMEYVEQICMVGQAHAHDGALRTDYRLCGLDADGKLWSRPCPTEQVPYVSLAIARYQKLRTLLEKKHSLETRLTNLVETLTVLHGQLRS